jgi:hypothetical protein
LAFDGDSTMTKRVVLALLGTALPNFGIFQLAQHAAIRTVAHRRST